MELNCEHWRGLTQQQRIDEFNSNFGDEAPSSTSVYRWYGEVNRGRNSLQDEFREGHPKLVVVPETIDAVHQLILQDRHMTYREIETTVEITRTSTHLILHEHLTVKKNLFALDPPYICQSFKKINQSEWQKCFDNWFKRIQKCIDLNGEYFEKQ